MSLSIIEAAVASWRYVLKFFLFIQAKDYRLKF